MGRVDLRRGGTPAPPEIKCTQSRRALKGARPGATFLECERAPGDRGWSAEYASAGPAGSADRGSCSGPRQSRGESSLHSGSNLCLPSDRHDGAAGRDRKSTRLNSSHGYISYAVFCLKKKKQNI